jgi:hypothetical protein
MCLRQFLPAVLFSVLICGVLPAQTPAPQAAPTVASILQPAAVQTGQALSALNIRRWKASNDVKDAQQGNATSIQNDLNSTLPGLVTQADAAPGSVPEAFAVYRNLDALYDVLLRVTENATLEAPRNEVEGLQSALDSLQKARSALGESIVNQARGQQAQLTQLRSAIQRAEAASAEHPQEKTVVVDDGAVTTPAHHRRTVKKKTPASSSSSSTSTSGQTQQSKPQPQSQPQQ